MNASVDSFTVIGRLQLNRDDKKYHLGLKVFTWADDPTHKNRYGANVNGDYWNNLPDYLNPAHTLKN